MRTGKYARPAAEPPSQELRDRLALRLTEVLGGDAGRFRATAEKMMADAKAAMPATPAAPTAPAAPAAAPAAPAAPKQN
jgi:hypothetical protein